MTETQEPLTNEQALPTEDTSLPAQKRRMRRHRRALFEWLIVLVAALVIALGLRSFALQVFYVPSSSMVPTLLVGDRIVVDKFLFNYHSLKEGDIVVFSRPASDTVCGTNEADLVKRVIGLPGQRISSRGNTILINGQPLSEPYLPVDDPLGSKAVVPQTIPKNHYFVMGDNRAVSCDSRYWGTISGSSVIGRVVAVIWRNGRPDLHVF